MFTTVSLILFCEVPFAQKPLTQKADPALVKLGKNFTSNYAEVNGRTIHYVRGGTMANIKAKLAKALKISENSPRKKVLPMAIKSKTA